jgi:hypothetical protein
MLPVINVVECDIIFLSYDEPNAEKNYADLCSKVPWAKRVHGVRGSDAAHKACAALSETEYFITVDADNIINPAFLQVQIDLDALGLTQDHVFSWCGKISVNGLQYGNGGLKLWTKKFVENMRTHEAADQDDADGAVDFCFDHRYYQFNENYSTSFICSSPFQAWRAGFREGVKMSLAQGSKAANIKEVWWQNYNRLLIWCNVGADVENGIWSMLGAREGCYLTACTDWNHNQVRDFEYLTEYWEEKYKGISNLSANTEILCLGTILHVDLGLEISALDSTGSAFFKKVYENTPRIIRRKL